MNQWIPVNEKLPEVEQRVLITNSRGKILCGQFNGVFDGNCQRWNWEGNTLIRVLAWMPMVEPYKES